MNKEELLQAEQLLVQALCEDLGTEGDLTAKSVVPVEQQAEAQIIAKQFGVLSGLEIAEMVFRKLEPEIEFETIWPDGSELEPGQVVAKIKGQAWAILAAERTALNFLQHLSGIASLTAQFVLTAAPEIKVLDTRKTTPGWRLLEKYAVRCGGGTNHRQGLFDRILVKGNHLNLKPFVADTLKQLDGQVYEVECRDLAELKAVLEFKPQVIMLDNFSNEQIEKAVGLIHKESPKTKIEVSGGITLERLEDLKQLGIDYISVGALTHSAKALDLSLRVKRI